MPPVDRFTTEPQSHGENIRTPGSSRVSASVSSPAFENTEVAEDTERIVAALDDLTCALAFCVAGNLACRRPFRPPFFDTRRISRDSVSPVAVDDAGESRAEALRRLMPAPHGVPTAHAEWPKPRGGLDSPPAGKIACRTSALIALCLPCPLPYGRGSVTLVIHL